MTANNITSDRITKLSGDPDTPAVLPLLSDAFRTSVVGDKRYQMVFSFPNKESLSAANEEWRTRNIQK